MAGLQGRPEDHKPDDPQIWIDYRNAVGGVLTRRGVHPWNLTQNVLQQDVISRRLLTTPEGHIEEGDDVDPRSRRMQDDAWEARRALAESVAASHTIDFTGAPMGRLELTRHDREMEQPQDVPITKADDFGKLLVRRRLIREVSGGDTIINNTIVNNIIDPYLHPWRRPPAGKYTAGLFVSSFARVTGLPDDTYFAVPIMIPKQSTFAGIALYLTYVLASGTVIVGLYADDPANGRPASLIAQSTEFTIPNPHSEDKLFAFSGGGVTLDPKWYWLVFVGDDIEAGNCAVATSVNTQLTGYTYIDPSTAGVGNAIPVVGFYNDTTGYPASPPALMDPFTGHKRVDNLVQPWPGDSAEPPRMLLY